MFAPRLRAPADQTGARTGWRPRLALLALIGALVVLVLSNWFETGVWGDDAASVDYRLDGPPWTGTVLLIAALALVAAAILLWVARRPAALALGVALVPLAVAGAAAAQSERSTAGRVASEQIRALVLGTSRDEVRSRLGVSAGSGTATVRARELDCLIYLDAKQHPTGTSIPLAVCFDGDRLAYRRAR